MVKKRFSIWLALCKEHNEKWQKVVTDFSVKCNSSSFAPHITIHGVQESFEKIDDNLTNIIGKHYPIKLKPRNFAFDDALNKSFYMTFYNSEQINMLHYDIKKALSSDYYFAPHMSLAYTKLPREKCQELTNILELSTILFDSILLVDTPKPLLQEKDVKLWNIVKKYKLLEG